MKVLITGIKGKNGGQPTDNKKGGGGKGQIPTSMCLTIEQLSTIVTFQMKLTWEECSLSTECDTVTYNSQ